MNIFLVGDGAVVASRNKSELFSGWGQILKERLSNQKVNLVSQELSTVSAPQSSFNLGLNTIDEEDIVLIHFDYPSGYEEGEKNSKEYVETMNQLIQRLKEKQVQVIICTPTRKDMRQEERFGFDNISALCRKIAEVMLV